MSKIYPQSAGSLDLPEGTYRGRMSTTAKRVTAFGTLIFLLCLCLLAASIVTIVKLYGRTDYLEGIEYGSGGHAEKQVGNQTEPLPPQPLSPPNKEESRPDSSINIPRPRAVKPEMKNIKYEAYQSYVQLLHASLNLSFNPCDNFYEYACGNHHGEDAFARVSSKNSHFLSERFIKHARSYTNNVYLPHAVKQAVILHNKCLAQGGKTIDPQRVDSKLAALGKRLGGVAFPAISPTPAPAENSSSSEPTQMLDIPLNPTTFATALGYLNYEENLPTLVPGYVDTNWRNPHGGQPYQFYIGPPQLMHHYAVFRRDLAELRDYFFNDTYLILASYALYKGVVLNDTQLRADIDAVLDLGYAIVARIITSQSHSNYTLRHNPYSVKDAMAAFPLFNFSAYLTAALPLLPAQALAETSDDYHFVVEAPAALNELLQLLFNGTVAPRTLYNYLYFRLLAENFHYLPHQPNITRMTDGEFSKRLAIREANYELLSSRSAGRGSTRGGLILPILPISANVNTPAGDYLDNNGSSVNWAMTSCMRQNTRLMKHATSRAFIDAFAPDAQARQRLRSAVGGVVGRITDAFQGMLAQLGWMSEASKQAALSKVRNLTKVIAYPEWVLDDGALDSYYASLPTFTEADNLTAMVDALTAFNRDKALSRLLVVDSGSDIDREHFTHSCAIANAWYQTRLNSMAVALGIIQPPFFHPSYPASVNHGALGSTVAHVLLHAFDTLGVQFDGTGMLATWIDAESQQRFNQMASCVVSQFNDYEGANVDGTQSLDENLVDSGGIQAAYRAFQNYRAVHGPDPQLPDEVYQAFSHDQLFFLSYAQPWCRSPSEERHIRNAENLHSWNKYRMLGTLQNFPAFRTAFNCPAGSLYAPEQHCQVWVSDDN